MTSILQNLINALRDELQQYGEMLVLLDQQSELGRASGGEDLLSSISAVNAHSATVQLARQTREEWRRELVHTLRLSSDANFSQVVPLLPEPYRPLVVALVQENNELLSRVRHRAQENQLLLRRSLEMMQQFLTSLAPSDHSGFVESDDTKVIAAPAGNSLYEAIA